MSRPRSNHFPNLYSWDKSLESMVDKKNELVVLADTMDWDAVEEAYNVHFSTNLGHPRFSGRFAFACQLIKVKFGYSDEELVDAMAHNTVYQYLAGFEYFDPANNTCSASSFSNFRKRLTPEIINTLNEKTNLSSEGNHLDNVLNEKQKELFLSYFSGDKKSKKANSPRKTSSKKNTKKTAEETEEDTKKFEPVPLFDESVLSDDVGNETNQDENNTDEDDSNPTDTPNSDSDSAADDKTDSDSDDSQGGSDSQPLPDPEPDNKKKHSDKTNVSCLSDEEIQNLPDGAQKLIDKCPLTQLLFAAGIINAPRKGVLILDATCIEANIKFPTDLRLIYESVAWSAKIINDLNKEFGNPSGAKTPPRTHIRKATKEFKGFSRDPKNAASPKMRDNIGKQLEYLRLNLKTIDRYQAAFPDKWQDCLDTTALNRLDTIHIVYEQQKAMYDKDVRYCGNRIVSLAQDWVRPIKRGKAEGKTEFGLKLHMQVIDGMVYAGYMSFDNFNEGSFEHLLIEILNYFNRTGCLPEKIYCDKLYSNNANRTLCKLLGIFILAPRKGRKPTYEDALEKEIKKGERVRVIIEGRFGLLKLADGLGNLRERLEETFISDVQMGLFIRNSRTNYLHAMA